MKKIIAIILTSIMVIILSACTSQADTVSHNISKAADSFEVQRRIIFFNGITDKYLLTMFTWK
jgi:protein involved in sex pheromone biosynthesis